MKNYIEIKSKIAKSSLLLVAGVLALCAAGVFIVGAL